MGAKRRGLIVLAVVLVAALAVATVAGCNSDSGTDPAGNSTGEDGEADSDGASESTDDAGDASSDAASQSDMEYDALRIAQAWFVAQTDFTKDQFEWTVESFVEADDGSYYARVSAAPNDGSLETEQIYVEKPVDLELWYPIDMGTGIDPSTDERFPEEVRDQL